MWERRIQLESVLRSVNQVFTFIDCITALKKTDVHTGFAFWIVFDWPEHNVATFESLICRKFYEAGVLIHSITGLSGRGMKRFFCLTLKEIHSECR